MPQDLYERWLDLPPGPRPPSPHALLGLPAGQWDEPTVDRAARRQLDKLDRYADHPARRARDAAARLMNEVARARNALVSAAAPAAVERETMATPPRATPEDASRSVAAPPGSTAAATAAAAPFGITPSARRRFILPAAILFMGIVLGVGGLRLLAPSPHAPVEPSPAPPLTITADPGELEWWQQVAIDLRDRLAVTIIERDALVEQLAAARSASEAAVSPPAPELPATPDARPPPPPPAATAPAEAPTPAAASPRTATAEPETPPPPAPLTRAAVLGELAAFVERPAAPVGTDPVDATLARRLVEVALFELSSAPAPPPLHVRAQLAQQMAAHRVRVEDAAAMAEGLFDEWAQALPPETTAHAAIPLSLLRFGRGANPALWSIGVAFAMLDRRAEFEQRLAGLPSHVLEQVIRSLESEHESALPGVYAAVLELIIEKRGDEAGPGEIDATIRLLIRYERPGSREVIAMAGLLPPRMRLSLLADAALAIQSNLTPADLDPLLTEAERVHEQEVARAPVASRDEVDTEVAARALMAKLYLGQGRLDDAARHADAIRDRVASITATADGLDWIEHSLRLAEVYHARGDVDRSRLLWAQADAAAERQIGDELETRGELAIARSMILAGENAQALRIIRRVPDSLIRDQTLATMISDVDMATAPINELLREIDADLQRFEALTRASALENRTTEQQEVDLRRALAIYAALGDRVRLAAWKGRLVEPLLRLRKVSELIEVTLKTDDPVENLSFTFHQASKFCTAAEIERMLIALVEDETVRSRFADASVTNLAQRGRPEEAEALERLMPRLEPRYAWLRSRTIGNAYLAAGDADRAATRMASLPPGNGDAALLPVVTAGAVHLHSPPLLDLARTVAARSQGWVNFFVTAAEALTGGETAEAINAAEPDPSSPFDENG